MNSGIKKRLLIWAAAAVVTAGSCCAQVFSNKILDIQFEESSDGIVANIITDKQSKVPVRATKSGDYYNIILPDFDKGANANYSPGGAVESVRLMTVPSSGGGSYTKIQIKAAPGFIVKAKSTVVTDSKRMELDLKKRYEKDVFEPTSQEELSNSKSDKDEEEIYEEDFSYEEEIVDDKKSYATSKNVPEPSSVVSETSEDKELVNKPVSKGIKTAKTPLYEKLLWAIGVFSILSVVAVLYLKGRQEMDTICGDMSVDISDETKIAEKKKAKQKALEEKERKIQEKKEALEKKQLEKELERLRKEAARKEKKSSAVAKTVVVEATPSDENPVTTVVQKVEALNNSVVIEPKVETVEQIIPPASEDNDYDVHDFLSSFVDTDDEVENEEVSSVQVKKTDDNVENNASESDSESVESNNLIDDLIDEVISTQEMVFNDADMAIIQERLKADLSQEMLEDLTQALSANILHEEVEQEPELPPMTLEEFDALYPEWSEEVIEQLLSSGIKFNDVDLDVIKNALSSFEIPEAAILDARLQRDLQEKENIDYYESEHDFAFTLIKPQEVQDLDELIVVKNDEYPDLDKADFSNDSILQEFSFVKPEAPETEAFSDEAPSVEDIERAMQGLNSALDSENNQEQGNEDKYANDPILSEFHLVQTEEDAPKADEHFTTTVFTSMEDISAQFKALGIDFDSDSEGGQLEAGGAQNVVVESEVANVAEGSVNPQVVENDERSINLGELEIYTKYSINDSIELFIAYYNGKTSLLGRKNSSISELYEFEDGKIPDSLSAREAEVTENAIRYIVRADRLKFVIEVTEDAVYPVMAL